LKCNNIKKYKIIVKKNGTPENSFGYHSNNKYLKKKFPRNKLTRMEQEIKNFFEWMNLLPKKKNLKMHHPLLNLKK